MKIGHHTKMRISVTILPGINKILENVSQKSGTSKSVLVELALKKFLQEELSKDSKALAVMTFDDLPSEDEWLLLATEIK